MNDKTILFCADASSVHTRRWVQAMAERGFDCVVATRHPPNSHGLPGAREVVSLHSGGGIAGWFLALPALRRLARTLAPRWVHGHYLTSYGMWAAQAAGALRAAGTPAPLVLTAWGSDVLVTPRQRDAYGRAMAALLKRTLARADLVTADSADALDAVRAYGTPARCEEVLWGADTARFVEGAPAPGFEVASLRAWEPNYRIDTVVAAFAALRRERPAAHAVLHLLGGGPLRDALRAQTAALGLREGADVHFTGRVDDAAMVATLQRCRVSVSVPESDATSVSLLESMACGLPVVASELPANARWVAPPWLVPVGDAAALAAALVRLHDDPVAAAALGAANRAAVAAHADRAKEMDRMAALLHALPRPLVTP